MLSVLCLYGVSCLLLLSGLAAYDCENPDLPKDPEFGYYIIEDVKPDKHDENYAFSTTPPGFSIRKSTIPGAGLGVFTEITIPKNTRLGPYLGVLVPGYAYGTIKDTRFTWAVQYNTPDYRVKHYVDGHLKNFTNWLRYVNTPNVVEQENLHHLQMNYEIYYVTYECIKAGTELMVWYGDSYGRLLGLNRTNSDYVRRFNEPARRTHRIHTHVLDKPQKYRSNCYKYFGTFKYPTPPGDKRSHVLFCLPGHTFDICKYVPCDVNPCTGIADCKSCDGLCFHMGHYIRPVKEFRYGDNVNTCTCHFNLTVTCTSELSTYKHMCLY